MILFFIKKILESTQFKKMRKTKNEKQTDSRRNGTARAAPRRAGPGGSHRPSARQPGRTNPPGRRRASPRAIAVQRRAARRPRAGVVRPDDHRPASSVARAFRPAWIRL